MTPSTATTSPTTSAPSGAAYALLLSGAAMLVGVTIEMFTPRRRARVDSAGTVVQTS